MNVIPDLRILVRETWNSSKYIEILDLYLWRRKWQPTPVFLPGESQGQRSQVGCCLWGRTESDMTEVIYTWVDFDVL